MSPAHYSKSLEGSCGLVDARDYGTNYRFPSGQQYPSKTNLSTEPHPHRHTKSIMQSEGRRAIPGTPIKYDQIRTGFVLKAIAPSFGRLSLPPLLPGPQTIRMRDDFGYTLLIAHATLSPASSMSYDATRSKGVRRKSSFSGVKRGQSRQRKPLL